MRVRITILLLLALAAGGDAAGQQTEAAKLVPPKGTDAKRLGSSVAISGDWILAGDPSIDGGVAHFFHRDPGGWTFRQSGRGSESSKFGFAISIDGDTAIIGAPLWDYSNTRSGKVYVYELQNEQWVRTQGIVPSDVDWQCRYGLAVAVSGDVLVVGAPNQTYFTLNDGEVFVYERTAGTWELVKRFFLPRTPEVSNLLYRFLGASVAIDGNILVAGAPGDTGGAVVYERGPNGWALEAVLEDPTPTAKDQFGASVAISGTTIVVGEPAEGAGAARPGSAFIFERDASGTWVFDKEIKASDGFATANGGDRFGRSVAIDGASIFVGMPFGQITGPSTGTGYLFRRGPKGWPVTETERMVAARSSGFGDGLGNRVGIDGGFMVAGAKGALSGGAKQGAVYVFETELGSSFCAANPNSTGMPARLTAIGSLRASDQDLTLSVRQCPKKRAGFFAMSLNRARRPMGAGVLCLGARVHRLLPLVATGPGGHAFHDTDFGSPIVAGRLAAGTTLCFQFLYLDPAGAPGGMNLSNAIAVTLD